MVLKSYGNIFKEERNIYLYIYFQACINEYLKRALKTRITSFNEGIIRALRTSETIHPNKILNVSWFHYLKLSLSTHIIYYIIMYSEKHQPQ